MLLHILHIHIAKFQFYRLAHSFHTKLENHLNRIAQLSNDP